MSTSQPVLQEETETHAFQVAVEAGLTSLEAGRSVPYDQVRAWLLSWGSDREKPTPK